MPFVRISLLQGRSPQALKQLADTVHQALVDHFEVPQDDRFQVIHQHRPEEFFYHPSYLGVERSEKLVVVCITAGKARSVETKQQFYWHLALALQETTGLRPQDLMVVVQHNEAIDWSFGNGEAQMLPLPSGAAHVL